MDFRLQPSTSVRRLSRRMRRFARATGGNVSLFAGITIVPLVIFVGAGIDYGRVLQAQAQLQAAADSAALTLAQTGRSLTVTQLAAQAQTLVAAGFYNPSTDGLTVAVTLSGTTTKSYQLKATTTFRTSLMAVAGLTDFPISANVTAQARNNARNRVALVLDNSGSMASAGKLSALQGAANNFLTALRNATTTSEDAYVSIVPFVDVVNIGAGTVNANYIDWRQWNSGTFTVGTRRTSNGNHSLWSGCVADRGDLAAPSAGNYDTNVSPPVNTDSATQFPAWVPGACPQAIQPLTNDWTALSAKINAMSANGYTNQAIGFAHGWMSLVGGGPYPAPPAEDPGYQYQKTIIILSDGMNTVNRWYGLASQIDARQALTCTNIKASGIQIYSIQVNTSGDPNSTVLRNCASDTSKFFEISSAADMPVIFDRIAGQLNQLSLTN